jgi:hypothetical protein
MVSDDCYLDTFTQVGAMQIPLLRQAHPDTFATARGTGFRIMRASLAFPMAYESADGFAHRVGLRNRHQLNRTLRQAALPSYRTLSAFSRILGLHAAAGIHHCSMCTEAIAEGFDPAWVYRTVQRTMGRRWTSVRHLSHDQLVSLFMSRYEGGGPRSSSSRELQFRAAIRRGR